MEEVEIIDSPYDLTIKKEEEFIMINNFPFSYSISKLEKGDGIKVKLYESKPSINVYFMYEALIQELTSNIKFFSLYKNLDEIITCFKKAFDEKKGKF